MTDHQSTYQDEPEEPLMNDDAEFLDGNEEPEREERPLRSRSFNLDMRHRIEDRLERRRMMKEMGDLDLFDVDDNQLH